MMILTTNASKLISSLDYMPQIVIKMVAAAVARNRFFQQFHCWKNHCEE